MLCEPPLDEPNVVLQRRSHQPLLCWLVKLPEQWLVNTEWYGSMLVRCVARAQLRSLTLADSPHGWPTLRSALACLTAFLIADIPPVVTLYDALVHNAHASVMHRIASEVHMPGKWRHAQLSTFAGTWCWNPILDE